MTTTAHEDQFTAEPEHVTHRPYDTAAILRQNVADLEMELRRQKERADVAFSELEATREDNHKMMGEILGLREQHAAATARLRDQIERVTSEWERAEAELKAAREQEPVAVLFIENGRIEDVPDQRGLRAIHDGSLAVYARPIPAPAPAVQCSDCGMTWDDQQKHADTCVAEMLRQDVPAPAVPDGDDFNGTTPHLIQCMEALVRLDADGVLVPHGIGRDASKLLSAAANRLRKQPAPSVPEEWREVMAELAADLQACIEAEHAYRDQYSSVMRKYQNDMRIVERARALLQSAEVKT